MSAKVTINIPNISTILTTYDQVRVYRSDNPNHVFEEITSIQESAAIMTSTVTEPFDINGLSLVISSKTINTQTTTFTTPNPLTLLDVITELNNNLTDIVAGTDGLGHLQLTSLGTGSDGRISIEQGSSATELLGFEVEQITTGKNARINLVAGQTEYVYIDVWGGSQYWYKTDYFNSGTSTGSTISLPEQGQYLLPEPERLAQHTSPRALCLYRGRNHVFQAEFWEDTLNRDIPLIPNDINKYPAVTILDVNGQIVANKVATEIVPGRYSFDWVVPSSSIISSDDRRYKCIWDFIALNGRQLTQVIEFDVKDPDIEPSIEDQAFKQLVLADKDIKFRYVTPHKPYDLTCDVLYKDTILQTTLMVDMDIETFNGNFIYSFIIPSTLYTKEMTIIGIWNIIETPTSHPNEIYQIYITTTPSILPFIVSLRMIIDKYRKRRDLPQHYDDGELLEYLNRGAEIINSMYPTTNWGYTAFPDPIKAHLYLASAIYALNAQGLLETDLNFSFSGQSVTLDYDHQSGLDSAISRMWNWLESQVPQAKMAMVRSQSAIAVTGVTPVTFRRRNRVFRLGTVKNNTQLNLNYFNYFNNLGVLF